MKIVIDIPEDVLKRTVFYREFIDLNDCVTTIKALENAISLPKHHGRLIDADAMQKYQIDTFGKRLLVIDTAPTIIEADKEG